MFFLFQKKGTKLIKKKKISYDGLAINSHEKN